MAKHSNDTDHASTMQNILITSFNVRGLRNETKRARVLRHMKDNYPGILFLQETYSLEGDEQIWSKIWKGDIYMSHGTNHSKGVAILIPDYIQTEIKNVEIDQHGRYIILNGRFGDKDLTLINYYAPTKNDSSEQMRYLDQLIPKINVYHENLILAGDLNVNLDPRIDKKGGKKENISPYATRLIDIFSEYNLVDIWRVCNPELARFTWRENTVSGIVQSRLDYIICPHSYLYQLKDTKIGNSVYSDHNPVTIELECMTEHKRGKGFWKFNNSLLTDNEYVTKAKNKIEECKQKYQNATDHCLTWDTIKAELRGVTISHATYRSKQRKQLLSDLTTEMTECEKTLAGNSDTNTYERYNTIKKEIEQINNHITKGIMIRAQAKYIEQNEASTKLFLGLEKSKAKTKNITNLIVNKKNITNPKEILLEEETFYKDLYTDKIDCQGNETIEAKKYFLTKPVNRVKIEDQTELEQDITDIEIANALKELPVHKSPGGDGFPVDFYKFFWPDIKILVCNSIRHAIQKGELSIEQKRAVLTLVPKKDKDIRLLKNWRPISLLNADYKILAKVLAIRMQNVIPYLVNQDQSGCIKNRSTFGNIRSIIDIINYVNDQKNTGIIAFIDYEKAFDTVNWAFMYDCLKHLNFGDNFISKIKVLYNNIETCVTNNGNSSRFFHPTRGIRQGCPVSAMLFIMVVEILANAIRNNPRINGIKIGNNEWKIGQYADDTSLFLNDEQSLTLSLTLIDMFSKCSGLKMNRDKSESMYIGSSSNFRHKTSTIKWTNGHVKCLGIYINNNNEKAAEYNIKQKFEKMENTIKIWKTRYLTLKGKVTIVNSLLISQMLYIASVMFIPEWAITKYQQLISQFIWDNKPPKIKYQTLIAPIDKGGLNLQDLKTKIEANKITWIKNMVQQDLKKPWKSYLQTIIDTEIEEIPKHNVKKITTKKVQEKFYTDMLKTWSKLHYIIPENAADIVLQPLWHNDLIQIGKKNANNVLLKQAGITHMIHLIDQNGKIRSKQNLENKHNIYIKQMEYNSIIHSIPKQWKPKLKNQTSLILKTVIENHCCIKINNSYRPLEEISTKDIYQYILDKDKIKPPTSQNRWIELYDDMDVDENFWKLIYETPFTLSKNSKVLMVQYKLIHRILAVNHNLKKWKRIDNSACKLCGDEDTIEHFIFHCPDSTILWTSIMKWWKSEFEFSIPISILEVLFGIPNEINDKHINLLNVVILHAKYYIYYAKKKEEKIDLYNYLLALKLELKLKKNYYKENNKINIFNDKWLELYNKI
jgi:endonuclease/exonuclease/phosphatase family metal-dependent hydrolase